MMAVEEKILHTQIVLIFQHNFPATLLLAPLLHNYYGLLTEEDSWESLGLQGDPTSLS